MPSEPMQLRYGGKTHSRVLEALKRRRQISEEAMAKRTDIWKDNEDQFLAYKPEKDVDAKRRNIRDNQGDPQYTTVIFPYSYAMLLSAHTYWSSVFLARDPIMQFKARHGEPASRVLSVEALIEYQLTVGKMIPALYNWLFEPGKYGLGILGVYWDETHENVSRIEEVPQTIMGVPIPGKFKKQKITEQVTGYQGNRVFNIRPYDFLPDPRVSMFEIQKGEFCGYKTKMNWSQILTRAATGEYFNIDVLERMRNSHHDVTVHEGSDQVELPETAIDLSTASIKDIGDVNITEMVVELVPKMWKIGKSDYPEKWVFTWAENRIIIGARPLGTYINMFPFCVLEYEIDAHQLFKRSMLEVVQPLQNTLDWLFNSHLYNVRQVLNNQLVIDPSRIVMKDARDPDAGKMIRLKPEAYGTDVRSAVSQLQVHDVTQTHLNDTQVILDFFQRVTGVNDNIMGMVNSGGRKSATEVRTSSTFGINRLKTQAEYFSATGWSDLADIMLGQTQQYYDMEQQFRIAGDLLMSHGGGPAFVNVSPDAIQGKFDFIPVDGTMPVDRFAQANLWREFLGGIAKTPAIAQQYDIGGIFGWVAQLAGLKNIQRFKIQVQGPGQIAQNAQAGNIVPIGGTGNVSLDSLNDTGQVSGVGSTG